jgi:glycosyltransferase involved in cell wall biosynthesis
MRVNLHDYSGHPFQAQLARYLAGRGHEVVHTYSAQYVTGHGRLDLQPGDPQQLSFHGLVADAPMVKYSPLGRARFEIAYAAAWRDWLDKQDFDLVVACNVPLLALARMRRYFARRKQPWVLWHQDIYSMGMSAELQRKLPAPFARRVSARLERLEASQVASANAVIGISDAFVAKYAEWHVRKPARQYVVPNWAPLDELVPSERDNAWARRVGVPNDGVRIVYAGTLGRKHNPLLLLDLLDKCRQRGVPASLTVVSEGVGADDLRAAAGDRTDVQVLGYQPAEDMSEVLGAADVLVALLEPDAAQFSVPSKVLSYLSVGRPIVALVPEGNPAAQDVSAAGGCAAEPTADGVRVAAEWIAHVSKDPRDLAVRAARARTLAEERFDIERIGARFEEIFATVLDESGVADAYIPTLNSLTPEPGTVA